MRFSEEEERFLKPGCDRLVALAGLLASSSLPYQVVRAGGDRHIIVRIGRGRPRLALIAHYDRFELSPGVLDNSCACIQLVRLGAALAPPGAALAPPGAALAPPGAAASAAPPFAIVFTDAEELPARGAPKAQGAYGLALALKASPGLAPPAFVLDVTGRGDRLVYSTSAESLLERRGLAASSAALGRRALVEAAISAAARASLKPPLPLALPWSDDLGLTLGGIPALAISLLPDEEVTALSHGMRPRTWDYLHTASDGPELAEEGAFGLMAAFLAQLVSPSA